MMHLLYLFIFTLTWSSMQCHNQWQVDFARNFAERREEGERNNIFPGTKWCGAGNISESYDDLGMFVETDKCCRDHDHCDDFMAPGEKKDNLENDSEYTKSHCKCDKAFYECLEVISDFPSNKVGYGYFTLLKTKCYEEDNCKEYESEGVCKEIESDSSAPKQLTWRNPKRFKFSFF